jgi:lipopolysaccharide transport system permease protein
MPHRRKPAGLRRRPGVTSVAEYRSSRELFANLTLRELRSKYKRSFLGWSWSMINPLANTLVYTIVFSYFFHTHPAKGHPSGLTPYAIYLLCALLPWNFFNTGIMSSVGNLVGNGNLIKKTYFPRSLLPASAVAAALVAHLIEMGVLLTIVLCFGNYYALIFLPFTLLIMALTAVFALGLGLMFSVLNVYFRDIEHFLSIFFLIWLYGTPIVYPNTIILTHTFNGVAGVVRLVPGTHIKLMSLMKINPMTEMELLMRQTLWNGTFPDWLQLLYYAAWAFGALWVGLKVFGHYEGRLAEEL